MKRIRIIIFTLLLLSFNAEILSAQNTEWKSFQVYNNDTINCVDFKGMKQGIWKKFYESKKRYKKSDWKKQQRNNKVKQ